MATQDPDAYKMMGIAVGFVVVVCAVSVDLWPWPQVAIVLGCLAAVAVEWTRRVSARYEAEREVYFGLIYRADLQHQAGIEGDLERWFYGDFVPVDEHNIFSDHWAKTLEPEPKPLPPVPTAPLRPEELCEGEADCQCRDCRHERRESRRRHAEAEFQRRATQRDRPGRLRVPAMAVAGYVDQMTGAQYTTYADGSVYMLRPGTTVPVEIRPAESGYMGHAVEVREYGKRDPKRVYYSPESDMSDSWDDDDPWSDPHEVNGAFGL